MLKEFTKVFLGILDGDTRWQLWNDFCEAVSITISQVVYSEEREKRFKEIMQKHRIEDFSKLFAITVSALDKNPEQDFLGTLFMQLELNSHWHGQFFTPYSLGAAMAKVNDFKCEEDYPLGVGGFVIKFRIGLTDFMTRCPISFESEADLMRINFFVLRFEEEFKECEEKAKAKLAFYGDEILKEKAWKISINDRTRRLEQFKKLLADEKKHKRFIRKKFVEKIWEIIA